MDTLEYVMTRNNVMPRMNARVLGAAEKHVDLSQHNGLLSALVSSAIHSFSFIHLFMSDHMGP